MREVHTDRLIAEKVFGAGGGLSSHFTKMLYRLCFQAPFAYRTTAHAVWAAYYRRKVLRLLSQYWFGLPCVADALYVRWDHAAQAFVMGTEYIAGRGPRLAPPDPDLLQRWLGVTTLSSRPVDEMDELVAFMERLRTHLRHSGFIGAQWQVDWRTLVATANCLHNGTTWVVVDLESGVPAVTLPRYLAEGIGIGRFPMFDDTNFAAVWSYVEEQRRALAQQLGRHTLRDLHRLLKELEVHEHLWKRGEMALLREPRRWIRREDRAHIRRQTLQRWHQEGRISSQVAQALEASTWHFLGYLAFGRLISGTRHWGKFVWDRQYRARVIAPRVARWVETGRLDASRSSILVNDPRLFALGVASCCALLPATLVRFLRDPDYRLAALTCAYRMLVDEQYQLSLAEQSIKNRINTWQSLQRLSEAEAAMLRETVAMPSAQEYVRGFGVHLALKAMLPSAVLDPLLIGTAVATGSLYPLALMFIRSMAITAYTLRRWIKHPDVRFGTALAIGLMPKVGILAYPSQLLTVHPNLSAFLMRDLAARLSEKLPIYGGRHTLTEQFCLRCADLPLSLGSFLAALSKGRPRVP